MDDDLMGSEDSMGTKDKVRAHHDPGWGCLVCEELALKIIFKKVYINVNLFL